jgi:hypothetical protein
MQLLYVDRPVEEEGVHPIDQEPAEIAAFIEAQLKTGVLLDADEWHERED